MRSDKSSTVDEGGRGRALGRGARRAATASAKGAVAAGSATGAAANYVYRQARRATHAQGAGRSGLSRLIELHAFHAGGDTAVAISLAGTLFFQVPPTRREARWRSSSG